MKKLAAILICFCMCIFMVSCKEPDFSDETIVGETEQETVAEDLAESPNTFKLRTAKILSEGKRAVPYYSENAVSLPLPEGFQRGFTSGTAQSVFFEDGNGAVITIRDLLRTEKGFSPDEALCPYASESDKGDGYMLFTLSDGSFEGYSMLSDELMLHFIIKGADKETSIGALRDVKLVPDKISSLQTEEFMSMVVLYFHEIGAETGISASEAISFVGANLWQSVNMAEMKIGENGESVILKTSEVQKLCDGFFGEGKIDASRGVFNKKGIEYNSESGEYTFSMLESSVYESFPETYFLKTGKVGVESNGDSVVITAQTEHTTISLGTTQSSTLKYTFTETEENGFELLQLDKIDF